MKFKKRTELENLIQEMLKIIGNFISSTLDLISLVRGKKKKKNKGDKK